MTENASRKVGDILAGLGAEIEELRTSIEGRMDKDEATLFVRDVEPASDEPSKVYSISPFLLRRPQSQKVAWRFEQPSLEAPVSQLCTAEQMRGQFHLQLCQELGVQYGAFHRKIWEWTYIFAVLRSKDLMTEGRRGLGFGTGTEPLPSVMARAGVQVTATDAPPDLKFSSDWSQTNEFTQNLEDLWHPSLVDHEQFLKNVAFRAVDMNDIPDDLIDYDFCWSSCCFEHLGSTRHGVEFLKNSLKVLRPGGVSIQTTEFNLDSDTETFESASTVIFRRQDIEAIIEELVDEGHTVAPLNLWPGATPVDEHIDLPPYSLPHLKLKLHGITTTSIGLIITKKN